MDKTEDKTEDKTTPEGFSELLLLEEANEIISRVNWKSLPPGYFGRAKIWLADYKTLLEGPGEREILLEGSGEKFTKVDLVAEDLRILPKVKKEEEDWIAKQADEIYNALTGITKEEG